MLWFKLDLIPVELRDLPKLPLVLLIWLLLPMLSWTFLSLQPAYCFCLLLYVWAKYEIGLAPITVLDLHSRIDLRMLWLTGWSITTFWATVSIIPICWWVVYASWVARCGSWLFCWSRAEGAVMFSCIGLKWFTDWKQLKLLTDLNGSYLWVCWVESKWTAWLLAIVTTLIVFLFSWYLFSFELLVEFWWLLLCPWVNSTGSLISTPIILSRSSSFCWSLFFSSLSTSCWWSVELKCSLVVSWSRVELTLDGITELAIEITLEFRASVLYPEFIQEGR